MDGDAGHRLIANSKVAFPIVDSVRAESSSNHRQRPNSGWTRRADP
jgi:hypothetical protein